MTGVVTGMTAAMTAMTAPNLPMTAVTTPVIAPVTPIPVTPQRRRRASARAGPPATRTHRR